MALAAEPSEWSAVLDACCGDDAELGARSRDTSTACPRPRTFSRRRRARWRRSSCWRDTRRWSATATSDAASALPDRARDRPRRHGARVSRRARGRAVRAAGRAQAAAPGLDSDVDRRPLPRRAADPRDAQSSEHRAAARRRRHRRRPAVPRDGIRRGRADRPLLRRRAACRCAQRLALLLDGRARGAVRAPEPRSCIATSSRRTSSSPARRRGEAARLRHRASCSRRT